MWGYRSWPQKKVGEFRIPTGKYDPKKGLVHRIERETIIGETDEWYVYRLMPTTTGELVGDKVVKKKILLPLGIHKTRLQKWLSGQLELFS
jgi:hypothetical protein